MKKIYLIVLLLLGLALALALGLALQGWVGASIVTPILYTAWMAQLIFDSVPGWLWWAWFLIIAVVIAMRSLKVRVRDTDRPNGSRAPTAGPVRIWAERLRTANQGGDYFRWHLARDLADLALHFTAYQAQRSEVRLDRTDYLTTLNAPPDVASYLHVGLTAPPWQPVKPLERVTRLWRPKKELTPLDLDPQKAVEFLEGQMEKEK